MFKSFRYHAEPEGKNLKDKISSLVRIGGIFGFYHGCQHIIFRDANKIYTLLEGVNIYAGYMVAPMAMGFTYATVRYALTNIRKKNDNWNGFLAGVAASPVVYAWVSHRIAQEARLIVLLPIFCGLIALGFEEVYQKMSLESPAYQGSKIRVFGDRPPTYSTWGLQ